MNQIDSCLEHSQFYSEEELASVRAEYVPAHVAVIPDGNRRWAKQQANLMRGHWRGASVLPTIVEAASELGIAALTVYSFSTENWHRPPEEIKTLLHIFKTYLRKNRQRMCDQGVRFETIGDLTPFPQPLKEEIKKTKHATEKGEELTLILAMNYGARDEMRRALISLLQDCEEGKIEKESISEQMISRYLDTSAYCDPELLIRTSGENRLSNFLLWQMAYTEVYVTPVLWPDFTPRDLLYAVKDFQKRTRRLGK